MNGHICIGLHSGNLDHYCTSGKKQKRKRIKETTTCTPFLLFSKKNLGLVVLVFPMFLFFRCCGNLGSHDNLKQQKHNELFPPAQKMSNCTTICVKQKHWGFSTFFILSGLSCFMCSRAQSTVNYGGMVQFSSLRESRFICLIT